MLNAIGYIRRSSDRQEESLGQQRARLEAFAKQQGWNLAHVYVDDAISGSEMQRPGLSQLLHDVEQRQDVGVSVERLDEGIEKRPESDWVVHPDAWPALVDADTFAKVRQRRQEGKARHQRTTGTAVRAGYLLTGLLHCGVCGGKLTGQTITSGKGYRTRYYVCSTHHNGHKDRCPNRYTVPAATVEQYIFGLIAADLARVRDDDKLHKYVADELRRVRGGNTDARDQLRRRLSDIDQKLAKLRDHLTALDPDTATDLGLYEQAKLIGEQRREVEAELRRIDPPTPDLPDVDELRQRAAATFDHLQTIIDGGTIEEKRELLAAYVQKIEADPHSCTVQISLYPALFSRGIVFAQPCSRRPVCFFCGAGPVE